MKITNEIQLSGVITVIARSSKSSSNSTQPVAFTDGEGGRQCWCQFESIATTAQPIGEQDKCFSGGASVHFQLP